MINKGEFRLSTSETRRSQQDSEPSWQRNVISLPGWNQQHARLEFSSSCLAGLECRQPSWLEWAARGGDLGVAGRRRMQGGKDTI